MRHLPTQHLGKHLKVLGLPMLMAGLLLVRAAVPSMIERITHDEGHVHAPIPSDVITVEDVQSPVVQGDDEGSPEARAHSDLLDVLKGESPSSPVWLRFLPKGLWSGVTVDCSRVPWWPRC